MLDKIKDAGSMLWSCMDDGEREIAMYAAAYVALWLLSSLGRRGAEAAEQRRLEEADLLADRIARRLARA